MNITAAELKKNFKLLSPVRSETYQIGDYGVSSQDSDVWVVVPSPLSGLGSLSLDGKRLSQVISRMSGQIEITAEERKVTLKSAKAVVELEAQTIKPQALPDKPDYWVAFSAPEFKKALSVAVASASPAKSANFGGVVQLQTLPHGLENTAPPGYRIVGTDGLVLTVVTSKTPVPFEFTWLLNLEAAAVVQIMDGPVIEIGETNKYLVLRSGGTVVYASKTTKAYPNFGPLLADTPKLVFGFQPENWLSAVRTVEPLIDESVDQGTIALHFAEGVVQWKTVGTGSTASDEAEYVQLEPDIFEPKTVSNLRLTAKYLSGFLSRATGDCTISLIDKTKPVRLESGGVMTLMMPAVGGTK